MFKTQKYALKDFEREILNSRPVKVQRLRFFKIQSNFNIGEFIFYMKNEFKETFQIPFYYQNNDLNTFWKFLEAIVKTNEPVCLNTINGATETLIYVEPVGKYNVRFVFISNNYYIKSNSIVKLDVLINKKELIFEFYNKLIKIFKDFDAIAYFEPPYPINYTFWTKDSKLIKEYLGIKK